MNFAAAIVLAYVAGLFSGWILAAVLHSTRQRFKPPPPRPERQNGDWPDDGHW